MLVGSLELGTANFLFPVSTMADDVQFVTLDPGHFHASLVQKFMYPQASPVVHVYALTGPDVEQHLQRIESFNTRTENPTHWEEKVYRGPDFLERMVSEKAGNVVVISGNNARKTEYIAKAVEAGFNVLADKPMAITPENFELLRKAFETAAAKRVLLYDIMTERHEITTILQRELSRMPELFGTLQKGTAEHPAIVIESVHYFFKEVAGKPLLRPAWFFDVRQEGDAIADVGTHLVDQVFWQCFPEQALDWRKEIKVIKARRWATKLTPEQFTRVTGLKEYPDYLKKDVGPDGTLNVFANGEMTFSVRGVYAKVTAAWDFEAPPGAKDSHQSLLRGTRANLDIKQGAEQHYQPTLYIENKSGKSARDFEKVVKAATTKLCASYPGVEIKSGGDGWELVIPEKYNVGHEAHFAEVTAGFLRHLKDGKVPSWEVPNMLAKYYATTEAYRLSHAGR
jgi:predicted dehydrogenase